MSEQIFRFKEFSVAHDLSAQKTGTDGVLLGAWTHIPSYANSILDIGTGSGLIALMLAQRTAASIDAIDLDENSYRQATLNFSNSKWSERLRSYHTRLQEFYPEKQYNLVVCNPPYFEKSLKPPLQGRSIARHDDTLAFDNLIIHSKRLLKVHGLLSVIIPYGRKENFIEVAVSNHFTLNRITKVKGNIEACYKRVLMEWQLNGDENSKPVEDELVIEIARNEYTDEYKRLTKDFYLKF